MPNRKLSPRQEEYQCLYEQAYHQLIVMNGLVSLFCQHILAKNEQGCSGITENQVAALRYQYQQLERLVGEALDFAESHLA